MNGVITVIRIYQDSDKIGVSNLIRMNMNMNMIEIMWVVW